MFYLKKVLFVLQNVGKKFLSCKLLIFVKFIKIFRVQLFVQPQIEILWILQKFCLINFLKGIFHFSKIEINNIEKGQSLHFYFKKLHLFKRQNFSIESSGFLLAFKYSECMVCPEENAW